MRNVLPIIITAIVLLTSCEGEPKVEAKLPVEIVVKADPIDSVKVVVENKLLENFSKIQLKGLDIKVWEISEFEFCKAMLDNYSDFSDMYGKHYITAMGSEFEKSAKDNYDKYKDLTTEWLGNLKVADKNKLFYQADAFVIKSDTTLIHKYFISEDYVIKNKILIR